MSALDTNRLSARNGRAGIILQIVQSISAWKELRQTRRALAQLSDRELNDIGLTRFDAERFGL